MMLARALWILSILFVLIVGPRIAPAESAVRAIWAVNDGEKVERDDRAHPARAGNSAWDRRRVRLFGARNEIVAVQVIVEADAKGHRRLSLSERFRSPRARPGRRPRT